MARSSRRATARSLLAREPHHRQWSSTTEPSRCTAKRTPISRSCARRTSPSTPALGGGEPGVFGLKGHIDAKKARGQDQGHLVLERHRRLLGADRSGHADAIWTSTSTPRLDGIPAAGITDITAHIDANYKSGEGLSGELAVDARQGSARSSPTAASTVAHNQFASGRSTCWPTSRRLDIEGTGEVTAGEMGDADDDGRSDGHAGRRLAAVAVRPVGQHPRRHRRSGSSRTRSASCNLVPPSFLPIENPVIEVGYQPEAGIHATLTTQFNAPMAKNGEKGTFVAGYATSAGLYAHIEFPITVPGFQAATVAGDLRSAGHPYRRHADSARTRASSSKPRSTIGYALRRLLHRGLDQAQAVGVDWSSTSASATTSKGLQILGITPKDKDATSEDHEIAHWHNRLPDDPARHHRRRIARPQVRHWASRRATACRRSSSRTRSSKAGSKRSTRAACRPSRSAARSRWARTSRCSLSVQVVGEIQLLIASATPASAPRSRRASNLELGADVNGRFAPGQGAQLEIDPFVGASARSRSRRSSPRCTPRSAGSRSSTRSGSSRRRTSRTSISDSSTRSIRSAYRSVAPAARTSERPLAARRRVRSDQRGRQEQAIARRRRRSEQRCARAREARARSRSRPRRTSSSSSPRVGRTA